MLHAVLVGALYAYVCKDVKIATRICCSLSQSQYALTFRFFLILFIYAAVDAVAVVVVMGIFHF